MDWLVWSSFALICAANIVTPGPAILNTVRRATQLGFRKVLPTIFGNTAGLIIAGSFCAGGVATFVLASELLWTLFRWLGVAYLAFLGLQLILKRETLDLSGSTAPQISGKNLFGEAMLLAVANPKAVLFFVALFPQVIDPGKPILPQAALMIGTYCAISILSLSSYSALASILRTRFITQTRYRVFQIVSGVILLAFAGKLAREMR